MKSHSRPRSPKSLELLSPRITIHILPPPKGTPDAIKVIGRFRPFTSQELEIDAASPMTCAIECGSIVQVGPSEQNKFAMDKVFDPDASQEEVFACIGTPIVEDVMTGYNGTVLAYGQTGSGKTYTMMGQEDGSNDGLIPRAAHQIFEMIAASDPQVVFTIKCSMMEIYKETLKDLLYPSDAKLTIKEDTNGIFIDGLSEDYIGDEDELMEKIAYGQQNRTVASTKLNSHSSRSHQLFVLTVKQTLPGGMEKTGILNLVDLAGSEKVNMSGVTGNKLEETKKINLSLSMLGHVIHSLSSGASHIPYRDSKLTRILQESLGGNFKTCLMVACSPHIRNLEETLSTLRFAQRAKTIKNKVVLNVKETAEAVIARLTKQLAEAYSHIESMKKGDPNHSMDLPPLLNKGSWGSPVSGDEEDARSFLSYQDSESGRIFDAQKTRETLMNQYEADLTAVKTQKKELESEVSNLRRKLRAAKREKVNCERTLMSIAGKTKQLSDKQVYLIEDIQKENRIQQLLKEVKTLKMRLHDARFCGEINPMCVDMEEEISLETEQQDKDQSSDSSESSESECSSTVHHVIPIDLEGVVTQPRWSHPSNSPLPSDLFMFRNQVLQLEAKSWLCSTLKHKNDVLQAQLTLAKAQTHELQSLCDHVLSAYKHIARNPAHGLDIVQEDHKPVMVKLLSQGGVARRQSCRASIAQFRFQLSQHKPSQAKDSFLLDRPTSCNPSVIDNEDRKEFMSAKWAEKIRKLLKSGLDGETKPGSNSRYSEIEERLSNIETRIYSSHKAEMDRWNRILSDLKENYDDEMYRKQEDVRVLNGLLASWVRRFLDLQEVRFPEEYERFCSKAEELIKVLDRTQQIAADSFHTKGLCSESVYEHRNIESPQGDLEEMIGMDE